MWLLAQVDTGHSAGSMMVSVSSSSVGSNDFQYFEGSQPLGGEFLALQLEVTMFCTEQNKISHLQL